MEQIFLAASRSAYYHKCGWTIQTANKLEGRTMVLSNWPTCDMRALTVAALFMLKNKECDIVVLYPVFDLDSSEQLIELGWTRSPASYSLTA